MSQRAGCLFAIGLAGAFALAAASAVAEESTCRQAISAFGKAKKDDVALGAAPTGKGDLINTLIALAQEADLKGNEKRCLRLVSEAKNIAGVWP